MEAIAERCEFGPGDCIAGKYVVERQLGEGSFGIVYKVKNRNYGQIYALKFFKFWEMDPRERKSMDARFHMEFETGRIKSDYLVQSVESGYIKGNPYIVMEFCPNGNLQKFVDKQKTADLSKIAREILGGLKVLHTCGKVHRDLKPENVLIKSDGTATLTDFGLSGDKRRKLTEANLLGRPLSIAGTPAYMAPEQANPPNREVTVLPTMDIFAFGVMMYELITGKYPFGPLNNQNDMVLYFKRAREEKWDKKALSGCREGEKFEPVISGCLKSNFKKRLQTVDHVLSLLPQSRDIPGLPPDPPDLSPAGGWDSFQKEAIHGVLLKIMQGEEYQAEYRLNELLRGKSKIITVGRNDFTVSNILPITENLSSVISRKHCTLELGTNRQWFIRDGQWDPNAENGWKNSTNGTYVNSEEVSSSGVPVSPGDIITIGDVKLRVEGY